MNMHDSHKIKCNQALAILGTSMVALVLGTMAVVIYDSVTAKIDLLAHVSSIAQLTASNSSAAVASNDTRVAQQTLDSLKDRSEIDAACLYLKNGQPFVFFATNGVGLVSLPQSVKQDEGHRFRGQRLILKRSVIFDDAPVGSIMISANLGRQTARFHALLVIALLSAAGLIGVALLLASRLQRPASDQITQLAQAANYITTYKDYRVRVENTSTDEIGTLFAAFNQMLSEIERKNHSLVESENRLKLALSGSQMGVWEWHFNNDTVSWSDRIHRIFGKPTDGTSLTSFTNRVHPDDADRVLCSLRDSAEHHVPFGTEYRVLTPHGKLIWVAHRGQIQNDAIGRPRVLGGIVQDISDRKQTEVDHQKLVASLLHAEEDERRRIARELHDTTTQHLAVLKLNFTRLCELQGTPPDPSLAAESFDLLDQAMQEVRTLTYLLHPPLLEQFGLVGALRDFASGVSQRNGVKTVFRSDDYEGRLSPTVELTLFRVVQESVTNAIRHSGTREILIRLARDPQEARVEVQDFGRGFATGSQSSRNSGVGIASMQERLALIGGALNVESDSEGVTVQASVPSGTEAPFTPSKEDNR